MKKNDTRFLYSDENVTNAALHLDVVCGPVLLDPALERID